MKGSKLNYEELRRAILEDPEAERIAEEAISEAWWARYESGAEERREELKRKMGPELYARFQALKAKAKEGK